MILKAIDTQSNPIMILVGYRNFRSKFQPFCITNIDEISELLDEDYSFTEYRDIIVRLRTGESVEFKLVLKE